VLAPPGLWTFFCVSGGPLPGSFFQHLAKTPRGSEVVVITVAGRAGQSKKLLCGVCACTAWQSNCVRLGGEALCVAFALWVSSGGPVFLLLVFARKQTTRKQREGETEAHGDGPRQTKRENQHLLSSVCAGGGFAGCVCAAWLLAKPHGKNVTAAGRVLSTTLPATWHVHALNARGFLPTTQQQGVTLPAT
jgi:hypothetical protein